jgi:hypothetical protein
MTASAAAHAASEDFVVHYTGAPGYLTKFAPLFLLFGALFWVATDPRTNMIFVDGSRDQRLLAASFFGAAFLLSVAAFAATALRVASGRPAMVIGPDGVLGFNEVTERTFAWADIETVVRWKNEIRLIRRARTPLGKAWRILESKRGASGVFDCILVPLKAVDRSEVDILASIRRYGPDLRIED